MDIALNCIEADHIGVQRLTLGGHGYCRRLTCGVRWKIATAEACRTGWFRLTVMWYNYLGLDNSVIGV